MKIIILLIVVAAADLFPQLRRTNATIITVA